MKPGKLTIVFGWALLFTGGCRWSLQQPHDKVIALKALCRGTPRQTSSHIALHRCPPDYDIQRILFEGDRTVTAIYQWLGINENPVRVQVLIFSPNEPEGKYWLKREEQRLNCTGSMFPKDNILLVVGSRDNPRFWRVLRHEMTHYALHSTLEPDTPIPFWLNEGTASLFEEGIDPEGHPLPSRERLKLLQYLSQTRPSLYLKPLVKAYHPDFTNGTAYARAWGIVAFLYDTNRCPVMYLQQLNQTKETPLVLFNNYILKTGETLTDFENTMRHWLTNHEP